MVEPQNLAGLKCIPCRGGTPPMEPAKVAEMLKQVEGWEAIEYKKLKKTIITKDFKSALELVNKIGEIAEEQNHHPNITFTWGKVTVTIWTHKIDGLTESDFILAAKIDRTAHNQ